MLGDVGCQKLTSDFIKEHPEVRALSMAGP